MSGTVDGNQEGTVRLTLLQWNAALSVLRSASGPGITWEVTHPLIMAISQQVQQQMHPQAQSENVVNMEKRHGE